MIESVFGLLLFVSATAQPLQPIITAINPASAPTMGASAFIVAGSNFGTDKSVLNLTIGSTSCQITYTFGSVLLATPLPAGVGRSLDVVLQATDTFTGLVSSGVFSKSFSYFAPTITSIAPQIIPTSGQIQATIFGGYFGVSNNGPTVSIPGGSVPSFITWVSDTSILCIMPSGVGGRKSLVVQVGQQFVTSNNIFSYMPPQIGTVDPGSIPASGFSTANVTGSGFGTFDSSPLFLVGGTQVLSSIWSADTSISINIAAGVGASRELVVAVAGQAGTKAAGVSYRPPSVSLLRPSVLKTDGTTILTIFGSNFGEIS